MRLDKTVNHREAKMSQQLLGLLRPFVAGASLRPHGPVYSGDQACDFACAGGFGRVVLGLRGRQERGGEDVFGFKLIVLQFLSGLRILLKH